VEYGRVKINIKVKEPKPLEEFLKPQGRFSHLFRPENAHILEALRRSVEENWERLVRLEESGITL
jgi:pyruvate ferredoxin oxidoreductase beta subunit